MKSARIVFLRKLKIFLLKLIAFRCLAELKFKKPPKLLVEYSNERLVSNACEKSERRVQIADDHISVYYYYLEYGGDLFSRNDFNNVGSFLRFWLHPNLYTASFFLAKYWMDKEPPQELRSAIANAKYGNTSDHTFMLVHMQIRAYQLLLEKIDGIFLGTHARLIDYLFFGNRSVNRSASDAILGKWIGINNNAVIFYKDRYVIEERNVQLAGMPNKREFEFQYQILDERPVYLRIKTSGIQGRQHEKRIYFSDDYHPLNL